MEKLEFDLVNAFSRVKKLASYNKKKRKITLDNYILLSTIKDKGIYNAELNTYYISISELADQLNKSKPALAKETRKLVSMKLIEKTLNLNDLRRGSISLTKEGMEKITSKDYFFIEPKDIIDKIGKKESKHLVKLLNQVNEVIDQKISMKGIIL